MRRPLALFLSLPLAVFVFALMAVGSPGTAFIKLADGFEYPVGTSHGEGYHVARGFRPNGHLGEDWNGNGGGDTDLGDPIHATANGIVVFAKDVRLGWGNVVILRHNYRDHDGLIKTVDSLYGHLQAILVNEGQQVQTGEIIGKMGNNRGMYDAHLHFEMHKNLNVGIDRSSFARDFSVYFDPRQFIDSHRNLTGSIGGYPVVMNTFNANPERALYSPVDDSTLSTREVLALRAGFTRAGTTPVKHSNWRVSRY